MNQIISLSIKLDNKIIQVLKDLTKFSWNIFIEFFLIFSYIKIFIINYIKEILPNISPMKILEIPVLKQPKAFFKKKLSVLKKLPIQKKKLVDISSMKYF